eukprot:2415472-Prymnesium_polylepis.3
MADGRAAAARRARTQGLRRTQPHLALGHVTSVHRDARRVGGHAPQRPGAPAGMPHSAPSGSWKHLVACKVGSHGGRMGVTRHGSHGS